MTDAQPMTVAELLAKIDQGWNDFNAYLLTLTPPQVTIPTDPAGWTALDHVIHIADWENSLIPFLDKESRLPVLGIDAATWAEGNYDKINGIMQQRSKNKSLAEAREYVMGIHQQLVDKLQTLSDEDLYRPYNYYQPESKHTSPIISLLQDDTYNHYEEHKAYIAIIVADRTPISKALLLASVQKGWNDLNTFLNGLTDEQKTVPTDAAGWTVKDHMMHMAVWEDGLTGKLDKQNRRVYMDIEEATWNSGDDPINAVIQQRYKDLPLAEVEQRRQSIHSKLLKQIDDLSEETLQSPFGAYDPNSPSERAVYEYIGSSTYYHYAEHLPWMAAIAES